MLFVWFTQPKPGNNHVHPERRSDHDPDREQIARVKPDAQPPADATVENNARYQVAERRPRITTRWLTGLCRTIHLLEILTGPRNCYDRTLSRAISVPTQITTTATRPTATPRPSTTRGLEAASAIASAVAVRK